MAMPYLITNGLLGWICCDYAHCSACRLPFATAFFGIFLIIAIELFVMIELNSKYFVR
jgi:hypothetical protein